MLTPNPNQQGPWTQTETGSWSQTRLPLPGLQISSLISHDARLIPPTKLTKRVVLT